MLCIVHGWIPEWPKGTDCKSAAYCFGGSNPPPSISCQPMVSCKTEPDGKAYAPVGDSRGTILILGCRRGGTGRRTGLKILRDLYSRTGSIPVAGIDILTSKLFIYKGLLYFLLCDSFGTFWNPNYVQWKVPSLRRLFCCHFHSRYF